MREQIGAWSALCRWLGWGALVVLAQLGPKRIRRRVIAGWAQADKALAPYLREP